MFREIQPEASANALQKNRLWGEPPSTLCHAGIRELQAWKLPVALDLDRRGIGKLHENRVNVACQSFSLPVVSPCFPCCLRRRYRVHRLAVPRNLAFLYKQSCERRYRFSSKFPNDGHLDVIYAGRRCVATTRR